MFNDQTILRRKLLQSANAAAIGGVGAERSLRVVLARAARDALALGLEVTKVQQTHASLVEVLELPPDRALIAVLEGPADGLGLFAISAPLLAAMTEMQTIGRVSAVVPAVRKPTRTDAAMVASFIDAALFGLETALADEADLTWAGGFRYASFLDDPRPLGLLLEDIAYTVLLADISVESGVRLGQILLALPAHGRGQRPNAAFQVMPEAVAGRIFANNLAEQVDAAGCVLHAVLHRLTLPLADVMAFQVGDVLPIIQASIDQITFEGLDGQRITLGRLGQNRGMRAVRLTLPPDAADRQDRVDVIEVKQVAVA